MSNTIGPVIALTGPLLAAGSVSKIAETHRVGLIMVSSCAVGCATLAALSTVHHPGLWLALLVMEGLSTAVFAVLALTLMQRVCHADLLGTVFGLQSSASGFAKPAGSSPATTDGGLWQIPGGTDVEAVVT